MELEQELALEVDLEEVGREVVPLAPLVHLCHHFAFHRGRGESPVGDLVLAVEAMALGEADFHHQLEASVKASALGHFGVRSFS